MRSPERNGPCPCGSEIKFKKCCGPYLAGTDYPPTAEALMRSRYTAFVAGNAAYLYRTTHPEHESVKGIERDAFIQDTVDYCRTVDFTGLEVLQVLPPDEQGVARVKFRAGYRVGGVEDAIEELSEFVQVDGRWVYLSGDQED